MSLNPDALRAELDPLPWPDRFERLKVVEKHASGDDRAVVTALRSELAAEALDQLQQSWDGIPLKEGLLRLPSKRMRGALTRAAKAARDRAVVHTMRTGDPQLRGCRGDHRFGIGLDERVVEMPLALGVARLDEPGYVLDAGAALNVPVVRELFPQPVARLTHFTLPGSEEPMHDQGDRVVYEFGDLRALPHEDGQFDRIVCVSTLEHVGMDTSRFGAATDGAGPDSAVAAVAELVRVLAPGGRLLITVPYGPCAEHGWFRVLDERALDLLLVPAHRHQLTMRFFYYDRGWFEAGAVPPAQAYQAAFAPDVITGVAIVVVTRGAAS